MNEKSNLINAIPEDVITYTLSFLDQKSLCRLSNVCKKAKQFSEKEALWKNLVASELTSKPKLDGLNYKSYYKKIKENLLAYSNDINQTIRQGIFNGFVPLAAAVKEGVEVLIHEFLKKGACIKSDDLFRSPFITAITSCNEEVLSLFFELEYFSDYELASALSASILTENDKIIGIVLKNGADKFLTMSNKRYHQSIGHYYTPVLQAAFNFKWKALLFLLENDADASEVLPFDGWTALHFAAREGQREVIVSLLDHGAKRHINLRNANNHAPIDLVLLEHSSKAELELLIPIFINNGSTIETAYTKVSTKYGIKYANELFKVNPEEFSLSKLCSIS